jgi:hypothetical protein
LKLKKFISIIIIVSFILTIPLAASAKMTFETTLKQFNYLLDDEAVINSFYLDTNNAYLLISENPSNLVNIAEFGRELTKDITDNYEKAKIIFNWFEENFTYDFDYLDILDAHMAELELINMIEDGALWKELWDDWAERYHVILDGPTGNRADVFYEKFLNRAGICDHYAHLYRIMTVGAGVPVDVVYGGGGDGTSHVWNIFWYDKEARWVLVDATWSIFDMPVEEFSKLGHHLVFYFEDENHEFTNYYNFSAMIFPEVAMQKGERRETAAIPAASPNGGRFTGSRSISLTTETEGAAIYFTLDGTTPTTESTLYAGAFSITATTTVKAIAVKEGMTNSDVLVITFTRQTSGGGGGGGTGGSSTVPVDIAPVTSDESAAPEPKIAYLYTTNDALLVLRFTAGLVTLTEEQMQLYDMNKDGVVSTTDALVILRIVAGVAG